jgi:hypothetical protein
MNPFTYSRANDAQSAVSGVAANPKAKFLGGGTNLVDLMKMGVEQPAQLFDINRLPLTQVEELPNNGGVRIGALVRNTAGGIATFAAILFVIPPLMNVLPQNWNDAASRYLPSNAGRAILSATRDSGSLAPWTGFGVFCAYAAGTLALAAVLLVRRDT